MSAESVSIISSGDFRAPTAKSTSSPLLLNTKKQKDKRDDPAAIRCSCKESRVARAVQVARSVWVRGVEPAAPDDDGGRTRNGWVAHRIDDDDEARRSLNSSCSIIIIDNNNV